MTTVVDTFNRANSSSTLGTTSDGTAVWAVVSPGVYGISSNQAVGVSNVGQQVPAYVETTGSDGTIQIDATTATAHEYLAFRFTDANNFWLFGGGGHLYKFVAGSLTSVDTYTPTLTPRTLKVILAGASISCYDSASGAPAVITASDAFNSSATKHGIVATATDAQFDNFSAVVTAPPAVFKPLRLTVRSRAVSRAAVI